MAGTAAKNTVQEHGNECVKSMHPDLISVRITVVKWNNLKAYDETALDNSLNMKTILILRSKLKITILIYFFLIECICVNSHKHHSDVELCSYSVT
jgi:hypothetical protein